MVDLKKILKLTLNKPIIASTDGSSIWSGCKKTTKIKRIAFTSCSYEPDSRYCKPYLHVEARFYFTKKDWNIWNDGLIYTDYKWINQVRKKFNELDCVKGLTSKSSLQYTEQGMQGDNYVSTAFTIYSTKKIDEFCKRNNIKKSDLYYKEEND